jgi:hypothetical protein
MTVLAIGIPMYERQAEDEIVEMNAWVAGRGLGEAEMCNGTL